MSAPLWRRAVFAGAVGALAMVGPGLALRARGYEVNRYGELLALQLTGSDRPLVLGVLHLLIGVVGALPLVVAARILPFTPARAVLAGTAYGAGFWLCVNAVTLPLLYGRPHPWNEGLDAGWPSLLLHVVYGVAVAVALHRAASTR